MVRAGSVGSIGSSVTLVKFWRGWYGCHGSSFDVGPGVSMGHNFGESGVGDANP